MKAAVTLIWAGIIALAIPAVGMAERGIQAVPKGSTVLQERRTALVIGNSAYRDAPLRNPSNDATDMAATLEKLGFEVTRLIDADKGTMLKAIDAFGRKLPQSDIGLLYFSGHGMQINGRNYLIPIKAHVTTETDVEIESVDVYRVLGRMEAAGNPTNIVILDACRNNPFARSFRSLSPGLAKVDAPAGSLIAFATSPGKLAADGRGRNGVFTKHLLQNLERSELSLTQVLMETRKGVADETGREQVPWESSSLMRDVYLAFSAAVIDDPSLSGPVKTTLKVEGTARGARVMIDGRAAGVLPTGDMAVAAGKRRVRVEKEGYETYERLIDVGQGRAVSLFVDLSPMGPPKARLYVETEPGDARVRVLNIAPVFEQGMELEPGRYHVEVSASGHETTKEWIDLSAGEDKRMRMRLNSVKAEAPGKRFTNSLDMTFVWIPPGKYLRGSPVAERNRYKDEEIREQSEEFEEARNYFKFVREKGQQQNVKELCSLGSGKYFQKSMVGENQHQVILTKGFWLQTTEVTQGQWRAVMDDNPSHFNSGDNYPVECVSWNEVQLFIDWLNARGEGRYRLPTEAEWEYAARAGSTAPFCFGDDEFRLGEYAWFDANSGGRPRPVGGKKPNAWGLYDMHGNVGELMQDGYVAYPSGTVTDPKWQSYGSHRVIRGGSWGSTPKGLRSAGRGMTTAGSANNYLGFRLAADQQR